MKRVLALIAMSAALAGCQSGYFGAPPPPNTVSGRPITSSDLPPPGASAAPLTPVFSGSPTPAESPRLEAREQGLLDADRAVGAAVQDRGLGSGLADVAEGDATVLTPTGVFVGVEQIRNGLKPTANAGQLFWAPERASLGASGDFGSTSGRYVQVLRGAEAVQGRYVSVWRKDSAGRWRIVSTTAVPVRIAPPPPPPKPTPAPVVRRTIRR